MKMGEDVRWFLKLQGKDVGTMTPGRAPSAGEEIWVLNDKRIISHVTDMRHTPDNCYIVYLKTR